MDGADTGGMDMKLVLGCMRRADEDFSMIQEGDRVAVGISVGVSVGTGVGVGVGGGVGSTGELPHPDRNTTTPSATRVFAIDDLPL